MSIKLLIAMVIAIALVVFGAQNTAPTSLRFLIWETPAVPVVAALAIAVTAGVLLSVLAAAPGRLRDLLQAEPVGGSDDLSVPHEPVPARTAPPTSIALPSKTEAEGAFRRIVFADDGTDFAEAALPQLERFALALDAEVVLVHALDIPAAFATAGQPVPEAEPSPRAERMRGALERSGVRNPRVVIVEGPAAAAILKIADEIGSDLIVMATHGRAGLSRALEGSVAEEVVRGAERVSVLLVRPEDQSAPG